MYNILIPKIIAKYLNKIAKDDKENAIRILFVIENLENANDPFLLKNCEKMGGYENIYCWKVGQHYRIIGEKIKDTLTLRFIENLKEENKYFSIEGIEDFLKKDKYGNN